MLAFVKNNAEWSSIGLVLLVAIAWAIFIPRQQPPHDEKDLRSRLQGAEIALQNNQKKLENSTSNAPNAEIAGCKVQIQLDKQNVEELQRDLVVWNRYEQKLREFEWGADFNWFIFASLRILVIVLGAITPALIVAEGLKDKKFLAALPAAIVAIGTGFIAEFDFKMEAARFEKAQVNLEYEKAAFIAQSPPLYGKEPILASSPTKPDSGIHPIRLVADVPFPDISNEFLNPIYPEARANFAARIEQVVQEEASERDQFLRGEKREAVRQSSAGENGGTGNKQRKKQSEKPKPQ